MASMQQPSSQQAFAPAWNGQSYTGPPPPMGRIPAPTNAPPTMPAAGAPPLVVAAIVGAAVVLLVLALGLFFYLRAG
jgi:hypothetical protein